MTAPTPGVLRVCVPSGTDPSDGCVIELLTGVWDPEWNSYGSEMRWRVIQLVLDPRGGRKVLEHTVAYAGDNDPVGPRPTFAQLDALDGYGVVWP